MNIVFFGSSKFVIPIIEVLRKNFDLKLVLTTENPKVSKTNLASQGETLRSSLRSWPVVKYCVENKIPYCSVFNLSDPKVNSQLLNANCQIAILADFGLIIPTEILNLFPKGIINIHPSLLPKYRGPTPVQTAILNGDKTTGVSIMKLDEEVDHGSILNQQKEKILDNDTSESLYERLFEIGANLLLKVIHNYLNGSLNPTPQNHKEVTFTSRLIRESGFIDIKDPPSPEKLKNMIKAYFPWPSVWLKTELNGKYRIIKLLPNNLITQHPNNPILIQVEGKKPVDIETFKRGYPETRQWLEKLLGQLV